MLFISGMYILPFNLQAKNENGIDSAAIITAEQQLAKVNLLLARVKEIRVMETNSMSSAEKKELKRELHAIKKQLKEQKKAATNGPIGSLIWIIIGASLGIIATLLFLLGAFS